MSQSSGSSNPSIILGSVEHAAALAPLLDTGDLIAIVRDEVAAGAVAAALTDLCPGSAVLLCPGSDALPGDAAPASPANVGQRVAALHKLGRLLGRKDRPAVALVSTGEAAARAYPPPEGFAAEPPVIAVGDDVDLAALHQTLLDLGYIADERVDEPGEVGLRGQVLDVFPADASLPLRIEAADGRIASIRQYDPVDQRSTAEVERRELGRVTEPAPGDKPVTLLDQLPGATVAITAAADERRTRLLKLVADSERRGSRRAGKDIVADHEWQQALRGRDIAPVERIGDPPPRFVEGTAPLRACAKLVRTALSDGDCVVLIGGERDLRFLGRRLANAAKHDMVDAHSWADVRAAAPGTLMSLDLQADRGFRRSGVLAIAAADLIGSRAETGVGAAYSAAPAFDTDMELRVGDLVIHEEHGLAVVAGLEQMSADGPDGSDAIVLRHADDALRLVPVAEADRVWRYGAEEDAVRLDKLDGSSWHKGAVSLMRTSLRRVHVGL